MLPRECQTPSVLISALLLFCCIFPVLLWTTMCGYHFQGSSEGLRDLTTSVWVVLRGQRSLSCF